MFNYAAPHIVGKLIVVTPETGKGHHPVHGEVDVLVAPGVYEIAAFSPDESLTHTTKGDAVLQIAHARAPILRDGKPSDELAPIVTVNDLFSRALLSPRANIHRDIETGRATFGEARISRDDPYILRDPNPVNVPDTDYLVSGYVYENTENGRSELVLHLLPETGTKQRSRYARFFLDIAPDTGPEFSYQWSLTQAEGLGLQEFRPMGWTEEEQKIAQRALDSWHEHHPFSLARCLENAAWREISRIRGLRKGLEEGVEFIQKAMDGELDTVLDRSALATLLTDLAAAIEHHDQTYTDRMSTLDAIRLNLITPFTRSAILPHIPGIIGLHAEEPESAPPQPGM